MPTKSQRKGCQFAGLGTLGHEAAAQTIFPQCLPPNPGEAGLEVMLEAWRPVVGYEGMYEVSDRGRVRSVPRIVEQSTRWNSTICRKMKPVVLAPQDNGHGYLTVYLSRHSRRQRRYIHRLMLEAFIGSPPDGKRHTAHWDGDRGNNTLENLRWATVKENQEDMIRHGSRLGALPRSHCPKGHPYSGDNLRLHRKGYQVCITCQCQATREHRRREKGAGIFRRRALKKAVRETVIAAAKGKCAVCAGEFGFLEVDHILSVELGGGDEMSNLRAICFVCHKEISKQQASDRAKRKRIQLQDGLLRGKLSRRDKVLARIWGLEG